MVYIWPIKGRISQGFGRPALSVEPTMWLAPDESKCKPTKFPGAVKYDDVHPGIDVVCPVGTPVLAPADGKVVARVTYRIYNPWKKVYVNGLYAEFRYFDDGKRQRILHVDHLSGAQPVGTLVKAGKPWAKTGNSGLSTGPHAHEEDRHGPSGRHWSDSWNWARHNPLLSLKGDPE